MVAGPPGLVTVPVDGEWLARRSEGDELRLRDTRGSKRRLLLAAARQGLDLVALCHDHNKLVDAWTYNLQDRENGFSDKEWAEFAALMDLKPDQITTDFAPATEAAWLKRMA